MNAALFAASLALFAPDLSSLSGAQQKAFAAITQEEFCHCQSALTLAGCLELRPTCKVASYLGDAVLRGLLTGASQSEVQNTLSQRVLTPFCARERKLLVTKAPSMGPSNAPITLVEFADFRCSHCKRAAPIVKAAVKKYGHKVRFAFAPYPLGNHPLSVRAAEAAFAAGAQGKFFEMAEALFAVEGELDEKRMDAVAQKLGLDMARYSRELSARTYLPLVEELKKAGDDAGIQGTPALFVNGRPYELEETFTLVHRFAMEMDRNTGSCQ